MTRIAIIVDTYEGTSSDPVLTHTFYGRDVAEARRVLEAHLRTDRFFAECARGRFVTPRGSFPCRNVVRR